MINHVCFLHQNYPAQFGPISEFLIRELGIEVSFLSEFITKPVINSVHHRFYDPKRLKPHKQRFFTRPFEDDVANMLGIKEAIQNLNKEPDLLVGHTGFGTLGLLHAAFPEIPRIGFFEYFYDPFGTTSDSRFEYPAPQANRQRIPLKNATQLIELEYCTKGYSPTLFQKSTYPKAYQDKLAVLFDGIDTAFYSTGTVKNNTELKRTWPKEAKVVTFVSRGLEAMRGFDIFMEVAYELCQQREDIHFVIAGNPRTHYGSELNNIEAQTFKDHVLQQRDYDLSRFHFLNWITPSALRDLFRLSDCHFYWTTPFTLSWSFFQAMATGCTMVASNSLPVRDVLIHDVNGLFVEPNQIEQWVDTILQVLERPQYYNHLGENARQLMVENYSFDICLPKLANFLLDKSSISPSEMQKEKLPI